MAALQIKKFNDPILRKKSEPVGEITKDVKKLIVDMVQTMDKNNGIGLAAPQVGVSKRIIVLRTEMESQRFFELINPKILHSSRETATEEEGCLSFPDIFIKIKRPAEIKVESQDITGKKIKFIAKGLLARALCHEIDHLNGILFFDKLGFFQKIKFKILNRWP